MHLKKANPGRANDHKHNDLSKESQSGCQLIDKFELNIFLLGKTDESSHFICVDVSQLFRLKLM